MLPGKNIESDWKNLDISERAQISEDAGRIFYLLNQFKFDFFGELSSSGPLPQTKEWPQYLEAKLAFHLNEARDLDLFEPSIVAAIWNNFNKSMTNLSKIKSGKLVHVDYHLGHLLHKDLKVTGVLDFEWAFSGDPLYDFCRWRDGHEDLSNSREPFLKGYNKNTFSDDELKCMDIYQMIRNIELSIVAQLHFSLEEAKEYLDVTIQQINSIST